MVVLYTTLIATLNIAIGFALAVYLGHSLRWPTVRLPKLRRSPEEDFEDGFDAPLGEPTGSAPSLPSSAEASAPPEPVPETEASDRASEASPAAENYEESAATRSAEFDEVESPAAGFAPEATGEPEADQPVREVDSFEAAEESKPRSASEAEDETGDGARAREARNEADARDEKEVSEALEQCELESTERFGADAEPEPQAGARDDQSETPPAEQGEFSVPQFMQSLGQFRERLAGFHDRIQRSPSDAGEEEVPQQVKEFRAIGREYLLQTRSATAQLERQLRDRFDAGGLNEQIRTAIAGQTECIEDADHRLAEQDEAAPKSAVRRVLVEESDTLLQGNRQLQQTLTAASYITESQPDLQEGLSPQLIDPQTQMGNRSTFELALGGFLKEHSVAAREFAAAMVELDGCEEVNEQFGGEVLDETISTVARLLAKAADGGQLVARYSETRFVVFCPQAKAETAVSIVEHVRQVMRATTFEHGGEQFRVTVSGGAVAGREDDTVETLCARLEAALDESHVAGPNHNMPESEK